LKRLHPIACSTLWSTGEVSREFFDDWKRRNSLSLTTAAEALGIS
jgi:hypothetical protein